MEKLRISKLIVYLKPFLEWQRFDCDLAPSTIAQRKHYLNHFFTWAGDRQWDQKTIQRFLRYLSKKDYTFSTRGGYFSVLSIFSKYLYNTYGLDNITKGVSFPWGKHYLETRRKIPSERRFFSPNEVEILIRFRDEKKRGRLPYQKEINDLYNGYFLLLASTGCRRGEALFLKVADIDITDKIVIFRETKAGDSRRVPIPPQLVEFFSEHLEKYQLTDRDPVFFSVRRYKQGNALKRLSNSATALELKRRAKALKIEKRVHEHMFRHTVATELIKANISILKVQRILGHHDIRMTQLYTQLVVEDLREAVLSLPYLTSGEDPEYVVQRVKGFLRGLKLQKLKGELSFEIKEKTREFTFRMKW